MWCSIQVNLDEHFSYFGSQLMSVTSVFPPLAAACSTRGTVYLLSFNHRLYFTNIHSCVSMFIFSQYPNCFLVVYSLWFD